MIVVKHNGQAHKVPCGKCAFCLVNRRSSWMFRVHHEMRNQNYPGYFLTLTYDEQHVKRVRTSSGVRLSLRFRDVQLFLKRVRKAKHYCKYICVGEYGSVTKRPHYHMLLWTDCKPDDLANYWRMGSIHFGTITMQSAMYTLKYIIQPKVKQEAFFDPLGNLEGVLEKTRAQFSRGIGIEYLNNGVYEWHSDDRDNPKYFSYINEQKVALPRYYRDKMFTKWQNDLNRETILEESMTKKARAMRDAIHKVKGKMTVAERVKKARLYLQLLRMDNASSILKKTKYNETF